MEFSTIPLPYPPQAKCGEIKKIKISLHFDDDDDDDDDDDNDNDNDNDNDDGETVIGAGVPSSDRREH